MTEKDEDVVRKLFWSGRITLDEKNAILDLEAERDSLRERANHWQHQFHVMGETAAKAETERDRWREAFQSKQLYPISEMEQKLAKVQAERDDYKFGRDFYRAESERYRAACSEAWKKLTDTIEHPEGVIFEVERILARALSPQEEQAPSS